MKKIKDYINYVLKDDNTEYGGISYDGETVADFFDEYNGNNKDKLLYLNDDIRILNYILKQCGINEVK